jgi:hypothetical protein
VWGGHWGVEWSLGCGVVIGGEGGRPIGVVVVGGRSGVGRA